MRGINEPGNKKGKSQTRRKKAISIMLSEFWGEPKAPHRLEIRRKGEGKN